MPKECKDPVNDGLVCAKLIEMKKCKNREGGIKCKKNDFETGFISDEDYQAAVDAVARTSSKQEAASSAAPPVLSVVARPVQSVAARPVQSVASRPVQSLSKLTAQQSAATSMTKSISILISGHATEEQTGMFFEDTDPESFNTLRPQFPYISDIIDNVHMISQAGRWGAIGICNLPLNESEMTTCESIFNQNPSRPTNEIMEILSQSLSKLLPPVIKDITQSTVTTRATIINFVKENSDLSYEMIKELLINQFGINITKLRSAFIWSWIGIVSTADTRQFTPKKILDQLLMRFKISQSNFVLAWRSKLDLGIHQLAVSLTRGTIYDLIRPCINKSYSFFSLAKEAHSGIHVLDLRINDTRINLQGDIISGDFNILHPNVNSPPNPVLNEITASLYDNKIFGTLDECFIKLYDIILSFKSLGYTEINIIDNSCRVSDKNDNFTQYGPDVNCKIHGEKDFRKKLTRCETRDPSIRFVNEDEVNTSSCEGKKSNASGACTISGGNFVSNEVAKFVMENIQDFPDYEKRLSIFSGLKDTEEKKEWISNQYLDLQNYYTNCAADIIIKYLKKTYQNGTDKLQKESLQFMITLFGKSITQHLKYADNTLSELRDIIIHKYFNGDEEDWKNKAYLICKDKQSNTSSSNNSKLFSKLDKFVTRL